VATKQVLALFGRALFVLPGGASTWAASFCGARLGAAGWRLAGRNADERSEAAGGQRIIRKARALAGRLFKV
jgi:hypothetical protein